MLTTGKTYASHRAAKAAARKKLGAQAVMNVDYKLVPVEDTSEAARASALPDALWTWEVIAAPVIARPAVSRSIVATEARSI